MIKSNNTFLFLCCSAFFLLFISFDVCAKENSNVNLKFKKIDLSSFERLEGSLGPINSILQDDYGFVWISGEQGLVRYDGHDFKVYSVGNNISDISGNIVNDLVIDLSGCLWVATMAGLSKYQPETDDFKNYSYDENLQRGLPHSNVTSISVDKENRILIGTANGFTIYNQKADQFIFVDIEFDSVPHKNLSNINDVHFDHRIANKNVVWLSTHQGVFELDLLTYKTLNHFLFKEDFLIKSTLSDIYGNLWMGTFGNGLVKMSPDGNFTFFKHDFYDIKSLGSDTVRHVFEDSNRNLWLALDHGGLNLYNYKSNDFIRFNNRLGDPDSISSNQTRCIFEDKDSNLWVGTYFGGINVVSARNSAIKTVTRNINENSLNHNAILSLYQTKDKHIWVGSEGGLNELDSNNEVVSSYEASTNSLDSLRANPVLAIQEDDNNDLWIGTWSGGLDYFDRKEKRFKNFSPESVSEGRLNSPYVWSLLFQDSNTLWVGTETGGLSRFDLRSEKFTPFTYLSQSPSIDESSAFTGLVTGLIKDNDNNIWISSMKGVYFLDVSTMTFTEYRQKVVLTDLHVEHKNVSNDNQESALVKPLFMLNELSLEHYENAFSIHFSSQNYASPRLNEYQYRLVGYNNRWINNQNKNYTNYTNLNSGKYRFEVKTNNIYGDSNGLVTSLNVTIKTAAWLSWWAYLTYISVLSLSIYLFLAYYRLKIHARLYGEFSTVYSLTQVYNRQGVAQLIEGYFTNNEMRQGLSLLVIGIDDFVSINKSLGYEVGDEVLVQFVGIMKSTLRVGDHIGRWDGETFVMLLKVGNINSSYLTAEKLRRAIESEHFWNQNKVVPVTVSIGSAVCTIGESFESLFKRADEAMYNARVNGQNQTFLG